jgi:cell wall-associated NlpC family hydrolase
MRRHILTLAALALLLAPAAAAKPRHWAQAEIKAVSAAGLLGGNAKSFRPDDELTQGELAELVGALQEQEAAMPADPSAPVTIGQLDAQLVRALGLRDVARRFADGLRAAGLRPRANFGTEIVARRLGLRPNHPSGQDELERSAADTATRGEAAYSAAHILRFSGWEVDNVRTESESFAPATIDGAAQEILQTAVSLVGNPYVWGGMSERPQELFGKELPGGFDCSGFVWRVFKLQPYARIAGLEATLKGRTTYAMSGEVKKKERIPLAELQPADLVFFGARGPKSKPVQINHMGIYLGGGWFVHSSDFGVAISPIANWYALRFAWGRRPLAEIAAA